MAMLALTVVSGIMQSEQQKKSGIEAKQLADLNAINTTNAANFKADQLRARANRQKAEGIIRGNEEKLKADFAASRVIALAGASGAGVFDKNIIDRVVGFEEKGDLNRRLMIYKGGIGALEDELAAEAATFSGISQANALIYEGETKKAAGERRAVGTLISTAGSAYSKYGQMSEAGAWG